VLEIRWFIEYHVPTVDWLDSSAQRARSDSLEETPLVAARKKNDSDAETISLQQEDDTEGKHAAEKSSEEPPQKVFIIQVGAFRSLAAAMNLMKGLREKGYDVYLDGRILPNLGLMHRVRIRGYASAAAARADAERLNKEEGLDSIVITSAQGARSDSLQARKVTVAQRKSLYNKKVRRKRGVPLSNQARNYPTWDISFRWGHFVIHPMLRNYRSDLRKKVMMPTWIFEPCRM
jgi:hypothetical protein